MTIDLIVININTNWTNIRCGEHLTPTRGDPARKEHALLIWKSRETRIYDNKIGLYAFEIIL